MTSILQFSGGKDSLACLYLMKEKWNDITVLWVNTGASYPETLAQMEMIRRLVPNFHEVTTSQEQNISTHGFPSDIIPALSSIIGVTCSGNNNHPIQSWSDCCNENLWKPLMDESIRLGATQIIRGTRLDDVMKSQVRNGDVIDGIEYVMPLQDWNDEDVKMYLDHIGVPLPDYYKWSDTSLDCWNCTAFLGERQKEISNMKHVHPEMWEEVRNRLSYINHMVYREQIPMFSILGIGNGNI